MRGGVSDCGGTVYVTSIVAVQSILYMSGIVI